MLGVSDPYCVIFTSVDTQLLIKTFYESQERKNSQGNHSKKNLRYFKQRYQKKQIGRALESCDQEFNSTLGNGSY